MNQVSEFISAYDKKIAMMISLILVVMMSLSLANVVWFFMENFYVDNISDARSTQSSPANSTRSQIDISKLNIFGQTQSKVVKRNITNVPNTSLNLELQGIFASENSAESKALIAPKGKGGELYNLGDKLPGNAILDSVFTTYVLIKRGSRIEKLSFPEGTLASNTLSLTNDLNRPINSSPSRLQNVRQRILDRQGGNNNGARHNITPNKKYQTADLQQSLAAYQNRLSSEPDAVLSELGVSPVSEGKAEGYRIGNQVSMPLLRKSGLQQGDVILSVNGRPVGNVISDQGLINQVVAAKRAKVEVRRGTRNFFITIPIPE
ncbi:MAG: PDZ domain-containing protein [Pseudomonadales bacterium]|nr:PDZ domain-containing protein [Pseudomonadales bacterium]